MTGVSRLDPEADHALFLLLRASWLYFRSMLWNIARRLSFVGWARRVIAFFLCCGSRGLV
jgi:hypothetical protein